MMKFTIDHRQSNPGLHELYVSYAVEEMHIIDTAVEALLDLSRITAREAANKLLDFVRDEARNNAAWFDAAALVKLGIEMPTDFAPVANVPDDSDIPF